MRFLLSIVLAFATPFFLHANNFSEAEQIGDELGAEALNSSEAEIVISELQALSPMNPLKAVPLIAPAEAGGK